MRLVVKVQGSLCACYRAGDEDLGWTFSACTKGMSHALGRRLRTGEILEIELEMKEVAHDIKINKTRNRNKLTIDMDVELDSGDRIDMRINYHGKSDQFIADLENTEKVFQEEIGDDDVRMKDATDEAVMNMIQRMIDAADKNNKRVRGLLGV